MAIFKKKLIYLAITSLPWTIQASSTEPPITPNDEKISTQEATSDTSNKNNEEEKYQLLLDKSGQPVFDTRLLHGVSSGVNQAINLDLNTKILPGKYNVDLTLNGDGISSVDIEFKSVDDQVIPCFSKNFLTGLNVDFSALPESSQPYLERMEAGECIPIQKAIPGATAEFDVGSLGLEISIPQAFLLKVPRGYVNPEFWDKGINAGMLRYRFNQYKTSGQFGSNSLFASIEAGVNINGWGFRHDGFWSKLSSAGTRENATYDSINTYVEKAIPSLKSHLSIGDSYTDGSVYESIGIRGVQLSSSDLMTPASMRGYSPVVRGFANSNARVSIRQNGILIYETTVAPGPFVIDDLYAAGYDANLDVTVTEADGSQSSFIVPTSSTPQLVRENQFRYSAALGQYRRAGSTTDFNLGRLSMQYGVSNNWTAYGGVTLGENYHSFLFGSAYSTRYGSFSGDFDAVDIDLKSPYGNKTDIGHRVRVGYSHFIRATQSAINVSLYSFANDYWSLDNFSSYRKKIDAYDPRFIPREKQRLQLAYNQNFKNIGSVYALYSRSAYWNNPDIMLTGQLGFARSFRINNYSFSFSVNYTKDRILNSPISDSDRLAISFNFPLGTEKPSTLSTSLIHDKQQGGSQQVRYSGVAGEDYRLSYGLSATHQAKQGEDAGMNVQYKARATTLEATASRSSGNTQYSASISGGVVIHSGGLTFANEIGDTVGLVHAPGAKGAKLSRAQGIEVNSSGYAVVPYLSPYERNTVILDTSNVSTEVSFESVSAQAVPYENSVVLMNFETILGKTALFDIDRMDGTPPPFGSVVMNMDGKEIGIVGQGGNTFVSGLQESGDFFVKWGETADEQCKVTFELIKDLAVDDVYRTRDVKCSPLAASSNTPKQ